MVELDESIQLREVRLQSGELAEVLDTDAVEVFDFDGDTVETSNVLGVRVEAELESEELFPPNLVKLGLGVAGQEPVAYVSHDKIAVKLRPQDDSAIERARFAARHNLVLLRVDRSNFIGTYKVSDGRLSEAFVALNDDSSVLFAEPLYFAGKDDFEEPENDLASNFGGLVDVPSLWNHRMMGRDFVPPGNLGQGVFVAVVDARCDTEHPDLTGITINNKEGFEFAPDHVPASVFVHHGTQVAGIIGGQTITAGGARLGIAPKSKIIPISIFTNRSSTYESRVNALTFLAEILKKKKLRDGKGNIHRVQKLVVNCSWQTIVPPPIALQEAFRELIDQGALVVCSAGNKGRVVDPHYPSDFEGCVSVSGVNPDKKKTRFANLGSNVDICAPGGRSSPAPDRDRILSLRFGGDTISGVGTSFAAPHVAAAAAVVWAAAPELTARDVVEVLYKNCEPADDEEALRDLLGSGIVNLGNAIANLAEGS